MKVFVTGVDGYIGVMMAPLLQRRGHEVVALDTGYYRDGCLYNGIDEVPRVHRRDLRHVNDSDLEGFDAVVHLAELSNDPLGQHNPEITLRDQPPGVRAARADGQAGRGQALHLHVLVQCLRRRPTAMSDRESLRPTRRRPTRNARSLVERDVSPLADDEFSPTFLRNATAFGAVAAHAIRHRPEQPGGPRLDRQGRSG